MPETENEINRDVLLERFAHVAFKVAAIRIVFLIVVVVPSVVYLFRKEWLIEGSWLMAAVSLCVPLVLPPCLRSLASFWSERLDHGSVF